MPGEGEISSRLESNRSSITAVIYKYRERIWNFADFEFIFRTVILQNSTKIRVWAVPLYTSGCAKGIEVLI